MTVIQLPLLLLLALQVLGLISTTLALRNPNLVEANGLLKLLFDKFGVLPTLVFVKLFLVTFLLCYMDEIDTRVIWLICAGYTYVVYNNFKLFINA